MNWKRKQGSGGFMELILVAIVVLGCIALVVILLLMPAYYDGLFDRWFG